MALEDDLYARLQAAQGDVQAQAALVAEFSIAVRPESERQSLREALDAAAVLHWFDAGLLGQVLEIPETEAQGRFETLKTLPFVEPYGTAGQGWFNVHENTRLGRRRRLAAEEPERFRALPMRASDCFGEDQTPAGRIEWIYHLLCGDPESGATALEELDRERSSSARPEDRYALTRSLDELVSSRLVAGRARVWVLLAVAWARHYRGETAQLAEIAAESLRLARESCDDRAEAEAQCLIGDVAQAQGGLDAAQATFAQDWAISRRLAEQNPGNASW